MATAHGTNQADLRHAWRVATATALCFVLAQWWQLAHANLAVWTTYMVMAQYAFTIFQKGLERILGRGLGILAGLVLLALLPDARLVRVLIEVILLTALFYLYFANWLAYTFLNAGLYLVAIVEIGHEGPAPAQTVGWEMFLAVVVGVLVADLVSWLTGAERDLHLQPGGGALLPLRADWLNHSMMLVASSLLVLVLTRWLGLPTEKAILSVFLLASTPHVQAALRKGELRLLGALLAVAWAAVTFVLVSRVPHFPVLLGMLFLGILVAATLARAGGSYAYAGVQMGLVLPLLAVVPPNEFGDLAAAWQRMEGIVAAVVATLLVGSLWPFFPQSPPSAGAPAPTQIR